MSTLRSTSKAKPVIALPATLTDGLPASVDVSAIERLRALGGIPLPASDTHRRECRPFLRAVEALPALECPYEARVAAQQLDWYLSGLIPLADDLFTDLPELAPSTALLRALKDERGGVPVPVSHMNLGLCKRYYWAVVDAADNDALVPVYVVATILRLAAENAPLLPAPPAPPPPRDAQQPKQPAAAQRAPRGWSNAKAIANAVPPEPGTRPRGDSRGSRSLKRLIASALGGSRDDVSKSTPPTPRSNASNAPSAWGSTWTTPAVSPMNGSFSRSSPGLAVATDRGNRTGATTPTAPTPTSATFSSASGSTRPSIDATADFRIASLHTRLARLDTRDSRDSPYTAATAAAASRDRSRAASPDGQRTPTTPHFDPDGSTEFVTSWVRASAEEERPHGWRWRK